MLQGEIKYILFQQSIEHSVTFYDHILCHRASINKHKRIKIISPILSDHSGLKLEISRWRNHRNYSNIWRWNDTFLNGNGSIKKSGRS